jgi:hypothetical protein
MGVDINQRNVTRNQSTADYTQKRVFLFGNSFDSGLLKNTNAAALGLESGVLLARAAGTYETASVVFNASGLTAGQTQILGGLTFTSTGATTQAQLAAAFANLEDGATTGAGASLGTYSGALTGWSTGSVTDTATVLFTATAVGNVTNLAETGTGANPTITIVSGGATASAGGLIPVTSSNLADVIGILTYEGSGTLGTDDELQVNMAIGGEIDGTELVLPSGVTLNTVVGNKTLKDVLNAVGFVVRDNVVENTNFDN